MLNNKFEEHNIAEMTFTSFASLSLLFLFSLSFSFSFLLLLNQLTRIKDYENNKCNN